MGWRDVSLGYIDGNGDTKNGRHFGDRAARQNGSYAGAVQRGGGGGGGGYALYFPISCYE